MPEIKMFQNSELQAFTWDWGVQHRPKTEFEVFKARSIALDYCLDAEKREQDARKQYERVCAIGHWMFYLGFPQHSFIEDDECLHLGQLLRTLVLSDK